MNFIALIITLILFQYLGSFAFLHKDSGFVYMIARPKDTNGGLSLYIICLVLPVVFVAACIYAISDILYSALALLFTVLIFAYSLGRIEYNNILISYSDAWHEANTEQLQEIVKPLTLEGDNKDLSKSAQFVAFREAFIYSAFQGFFAVLFWFVLLGPAGALLFRLNTMYVLNNPLPLAKKVQGVLEWPAAFLTSLTFVLVGNFERGMYCWENSVFNRGMNNKNIIHANALAALDLDMHWLVSQKEEADVNVVQQVKEECLALSRLVRRAAIFAVLLMAIFHIII